MKPKELERIVGRHEKPCLELKESFNVVCIATVCAVTLRGGCIITIGM